MPPTTRAAAKLAKSKDSISTARPRIPSRLLDLSATPEGQSQIQNPDLRVAGNCPTSESPRIHLAREDNTVSDGMRDDSCFTIRHEECGNNVTTKSGLNLDVLRVCRRIYREASLLPFEENTFVFGLHAPIGGPPPTMAGFVNRLKREQREAVRHVTIVSGKIRIAEFKSQIGQLRGLRALHMLVAPGTDAYEFYWALSNCLAFATMYWLGFLPLKKFRMSIEAYLDRRALDALRSRALEYDRLVRYIEAVFLYRNSNVAEAKNALLGFQEFEAETGYFDKRLKELGDESQKMLNYATVFV
ncbi:hypothetical protein MBLNU13_g11080t1 [Cladosporium sp. NU13]